MELENKTKLEKLIQFLESKDAPILGALFAITAQLWHAVDAYVKISASLTFEYQWSSASMYGYLFLGIMFALAVSFGILVMTVRGNMRMAYFFLSVEVFVNAIHFAVYQQADIGLILSTAFLCLIIPIVITAYSHEVKQGRYKRDEEILNDVEEILGFDVRNPDNTFGSPLSDEDIKKIRVAMAEKETKNKFTLQKEIREILSQRAKGNGHFK